MAESPSPSSETLRRARLSWEQSQADLKSARSSHKAGQFMHGSFLCLQSALNGLAAICQVHGHFHLPNGGPAPLLALCVDSDPAFPTLECPQLERVLERNPFAPEDSSDPAAAFSQACLAECEALCQSIRRYLKANQGRFFKP
jgi:hypothetical protein